MLTNLPERDLLSCHGKQDAALAPRASGKARTPLRSEAKKAAVDVSLAPVQASDGDAPQPLDVPLNRSLLRKLVQAVIVESRKGPSLSGKAAQWRDGMDPVQDAVERAIAYPQGRYQVAQGLAQTRVGFDQALVELQAQQTTRLGGYAHCNLEAFYAKVRAGLFPSHMSWRLKCIGLRLMDFEQALPATVNKRLTAPPMRLDEAGKELALLPYFSSTWKG